MVSAIKQEVAKILLEIGAVTLSPKKLFTWASGIQSPIYCDNRLLMTYPEARREIREAFCHLLKEKEPNCELIAGVATGAIVHAAWVAEHLNKPMVYVRSQAKDHGKQNLVEGKVEPGKLAIVIEDLVSTGGSSCAAIEALRDSGGKVNHCLAIFTYGFPEAVKKFEAIQCNLTTLTDFSTLLQLAKERRIISAEEQTLLQRFSANPRGWLD
ncbi:MAG: orotate phosphoribosyltransferase [Deltaproteobacteria bacterium RIFCSPLOWO2_01_44_7]|nr:MAG: orotate phosphoribosyltransferase [Deltaproteobacteria bacterium RIFCSPHIGHO2_01_FULL_43_49]OGQ14790.1 MAG: orotate phosphoribosyltransferase [Deltaproteobacteria bacterium RIFCSPHIGHO2_02_FULL_44_53]OGQ28176.1 MAG: orotate phosphoribosyltransferase [Deltaproteobacteria bacterium RIFCSPHIGHO2_12_FULL_44_21]OGQ31388.1 MAG: orotate phosphoribosyltransferase [Deltaproteobacteria bacterium RIFCSPLOWO2_01_FULL_45_74]OGQ39599.1 MAG: orotate phosphoribosyltransferase [Deltaproteobacteria bacte